MKRVRYLLIGVLVLGCTAREPAAVRQNPIVSQFEHIHADAKEFRRDIEFINDKIERPPKSADPKYVAKAWSLVLDAFRNNRGLEGAQSDLLSLVLDAPPSDTSAAMASVEFVTRSLPTAAFMLDLVRREKRIRKDLDDAVENATLAIARDQLSSRETQEISAFVTLIKREFEAADKATKRTLPSPSK
jgi:hypothetical protein